MPPLGISVRPDCDLNVKIYVNKLSLERKGTAHGWLPGGAGLPGSALLRDRRIWW